MPTKKERVKSVMISLDNTSFQEAVDILSTCLGMVLSHATPTNMTKMIPALAILITDYYKSFRKAAKRYFG